VRKISKTRGAIFGSNSTGRAPQVVNPYRAAELSGAPSNFGAQLTRFKLGQRLPSKRR